MKTTCYILLLLIALISCKPTQVIHERYISTVDSTAVGTLKEMLHAEVQKNETLRTQLERTKQENLKLTNEIESHEINYDTSAPVDKETGRYPIASETITTTKSVLEKQIKEQETLLKEQDIEIKAQAQQNKNLEYQVESLRNENSELKSKTTKCGLSFKWLIYGIVAGVLLSIAAVIFLRFT